MPSRTPRTHPTLFADVICTDANDRPQGYQRLTYLTESEQHNKRSDVNFLSRGRHVSAVKCGYHGALRQQYKR
jgi:hypothetical protein